MKLVSFHWQGNRHRTWLHVETTSAPWTYYIPPHSPVRESDGTEWSSSYPVVAFFVPQQFYQIFMLLKDSGVEYYCDVIAPPLVMRDSLYFVDLDLDVIVENGKPRVVDEDEFEARNRAYPEQIRRGAREGMKTLLYLAESAAGPFDKNVVNKWIRYATETESL